MEQGQQLTKVYKHTFLLNGTTHISSLAPNEEKARERVAGLFKDIESCELTGCEFSHESGYYSITQNKPKHKPVVARQQVATPSVKKSENPTDELLIDNVLSQHTRNTKVEL